MAEYVTDNLRTVLKALLKKKVTNCVTGHLQINRKRYINLRMKVTQVKFYVAFDFCI